MTSNYSESSENQKLFQKSLGLTKSVLKVLVEIAKIGPCCAILNETQVHIVLIEYIMKTGKFVAYGRNH